MGGTQYGRYNSEEVFRQLHQAVAHEHGRAELAKTYSHKEADVVEACLKTEKDVLVWLDLVELTFRYIERALSKISASDRDIRDISIPSDKAISELNVRFQRAAFGYRYEDGGIIRIDNEYVHSEITKPALLLLHDKRFAGANDEFRAAHDHYKAGEYRDCAVDANNALESTMKAICEIKGWEVQKGARASDLLKVLRREGLFPDFAEQSFDQLVSTLRSGLPALRNETGGHGQGATPVEVPEYIAAYALHLAASKIRFLYEAFRTLE